MKKVIMALVFMMFTTSLFAVDYIDVVEKTDGSVLKGIIIENKINEFVRIELSGGSVFKIDYSDIDSLKKERSNSSGEGNIVINNTNTNTLSNNGSGSDIITGYDHFELIGLLEDIPLSKLKKTNLDPGLMRNTEISTRMAVYKTLKEDSVAGYTILNFLVPGVGSIYQGDKGKGWLTLIGSSLCTVLGYVFYFDYANSLTNYDYYTNSYETNDDALALSAAFFLAAGSINISSWFAPSSYKKRYNEQLKTTLMY